MTTWYRKPLGHGPAVFQSLRQLRELRCSHDRNFSESSVFIAALDVPNGEMWLYIPPGNSDFAEVYLAEPCSEPVFDRNTLIELSTEAHPAQPPVRTLNVDGALVEEHRFNLPSRAVLESGMDPYQDESQPADMATSITTRVRS